MRLEDIDLVAPVVVVGPGSARVQAVEVMGPRLVPVERATAGWRALLELVAIGRPTPRPGGKPHVELRIEEERMREWRIERRERSCDDEPPNDVACVVKDLAVADPIEQCAQRRLALLDAVCIELV